MEGINMPKVLTNQDFMSKDAKRNYTITTNKIGRKNYIDQNGNTLRVDGSLKLMNSKMDLVELKEDGIKKLLTS